MKKLLSIMLAISMIFLAPMNATADAANEEDTYWPGMDFKSISEFETYLKECHQNNSFDAIGKYYSAMNNIYVPEKLKGNEKNIIGIAAEFISYYRVSYKLDGVIYGLTTYHGFSKEGFFDYSYNTAKKIVEKPADDDLYSFVRKHEVNGNTVYSYYLLGETFYNWKQGDYYFELRIDEKPNDKHLEYCNAAAMPLNLTGAAGSNTNDNPTTGR